MPGFDRFWSKVTTTDSCWLWTAACGADGYGRFGVGKQSKLAHRVAYEATHGPIPTGMVLDHLCFVRRCVNPEHLRTTDVAGNGQNRQGAQRNNLSTGVRGVTYFRGKFLVQVKTRGRNHYIGRFASLADAEMAAIEARERMFLVPGGSRISNPIAKKQEGN